MYFANKSCFTKTFSSVTSLGTGAASEIFSLWHPNIHGGSGGGVTAHDPVKVARSAGLPQVRQVNTGGPESGTFRPPPPFRHSCINCGGMTSSVHTVGHHVSIVVAENAACKASHFEKRRKYCMIIIYTLCLKKGYHPTTNDNFYSSCPIPVIFGTNIAE